MDCALGMERPAFAERNLWNVGPLLLFRLDVGSPNQLAPFLNFFGNEDPKLGRRAGKNHAAEVGELSLQLGIGEASIDFLVELIDDLTRRFRGGPLDS